MSKLRPSAAFRGAEEAREAKQRRKWRDRMRATEGAPRNRCRRLFGVATISIRTTSSVAAGSPERHRVNTAALLKSDIMTLSRTRRREIFLRSTDLVRSIYGALRCIKAIRRSS